MENIYWNAVVLAAVVIIGFCLGRISYRVKDESADTAERQARGRRAPEKGKSELSGSPVGSPVSGEIENLRGGEKPMVVIHPGEDRIYAPSGGKITKLFPMGNAFLFQTEFGAELYIQAGESKDELLGRYFRPRVVQNEIVGKGKLLLEFDRKGLEAEGVSTSVSVVVENDPGGSDLLTEIGSRVRTGEEILRMQSGVSDIHRG